METLLRVALDSLSWIIGFWTLVGYKAINKCIIIIIIIIKLIYKTGGKVCITAHRMIAAIHVS